MPPACPKTRTSTINTTEPGPEPEVSARLYGEPLRTIPQGLYIPPDALEVFLESFEGPLDLLLFLIRKQNFDVLDIPMSQLTEQYLAYVEQIRHTNLELAGDYLVMAAVLVEIKSRMLLPVSAPEASDEVEDPRAQLVRRLLLYEHIKQAARQLDALPRAGRDFQVACVHTEPAQPHRVPEAGVAELVAAWTALQRRAALHVRHRIASEPLSVREQMAYVLERLSPRSFTSFTDLVMERLTIGEPAAVIVVLFLALLELTRESMLELAQARPYAPLYARRRDARGR